MTTGQIVVITLRLIVPLLILRRPLAGGIIAMLLDGLDVVIVEWFSSGGMGDYYHSLDKVLDLYYLGLEAWVARGWANPIARATALGLFAYRVVGVALFELIGQRWLLFVFPNLFELWFLAYLIVCTFFPRWEPKTWPAMIGWLLVLLIPKMAQEYLLHIAEAQPWAWLKRTFPFLE